MKGKRRYYVYIMASRSLNLYTGITNSLFHRSLQHKSGEIDGFTKRYNINRLVYYEVFESVGNAIAQLENTSPLLSIKKLRIHTASEDPEMQKVVFTAATIIYKK